MTTRRHLTLGEAAHVLHVRDWQLTRIYRKGAVPEPPRLGRYRLIDQADLPALREALEAAGYLPPREVPA